MSIKEALIDELSRLSDTELRQVADYIAFLKFRARRTRSAMLPAAAQLAALYAEAAEEDRQLAEVGMDTYSAHLYDEDKS